METDTAWGFLGILAGGTIALARELARRHYDSVEAARARGIEATLLAHERIQSALALALNASRYDSVLLVRVANGGDIPEPSKPLYVSVLQEAFNERLQPTRGSWARQPMDEGYVSLMLRVVRDGAVSVVVADMPPSILRHAWEAQGIVSADVVLVRRDQSEMWVLGFHALDLVTPTPREWEEIRRCQAVCRDAVQAI